MTGWRAILAVATVAGALGSLAEAGELVFKNGNRLAADLTSQTILVSTGADLFEIPPELVLRLRGDEIRTKDGRTIKGTVVGGTVRAWTVYGEIAVAIGDLEEFRADLPAPAASTREPADPPRPTAGVRASRGPSAAEGPGQVVDGAHTIARGVRDTTRGIGRTVTDGVDRVHDAFKAVGQAIWQGLTTARRAAGKVLTD
jgi:hypothetical protein